MTDPDPFATADDLYAAAEASELDADAYVIVVVDQADGRLLFTTGPHAGVADAFAQAHRCEQDINLGLPEGDLGCRALPVPLCPPDT